jgi:hypothetical protein
LWVALTEVIKLYVCIEKQTQGITIKGGSKMQYTIKLADGRELTGLTKNGDNYVSKEKVDETIFTDNLATMMVYDGETETTYKNVELIQQMEFLDGFYLCFRELTEAELAVTDLQKALAEVYELIVGGGI